MSFHVLPELSVRPVLENRLVREIGRRGRATAWDLAGDLFPRVFGLVQPDAARHVQQCLEALAAQGRVQSPERPCMFTAFEIAAEHRRAGGGSAPRSSRP